MIHPTKNKEKDNEYKKLIQGAQDIYDICNFGKKKSELAEEFKYLR